MVWHGSQWIAYRLVTTLAAVVILQDLVCHHNTGRGHIGVDMWLLGVFLPVVLVPQIIQIITAAHLQSNECSPWIHAQLTIASSVLAVTDALLQTSLVFYGSQFSPHHRTRDEQVQTFTSEKDPLNGQRQTSCWTKHFLVILALCDISIWIIKSLEALNKQMRAFSAPSQYFGAEIWLNIDSCFNPVQALFYFHCFACLWELFVVFTPENRTPDV